MGRLSGIWLDMATRSQNQGMLEDLCKERPLCLDGLALPGQFVCYHIQPAWNMSGFKGYLFPGTPGQDSFNSFKARKTAFSSR